MDILLLYLISYKCNHVIDLIIIPITNTNTTIVFYDNNQSFSSFTKLSVLNPICAEVFLVELGIYIALKLVKYPVCQQTSKHIMLTQHSKKLNDIIDFAILVYVHRSILQSDYVHIAPNLSKIQ